MKGCFASLYFYAFFTFIVVIIIEKCYNVPNSIFGGIHND